MRGILVLVLLLGACATARPGTFADRPVAWRVDDTREIREPAARDFDQLRHFTDGYVFAPAYRALRPTRGRALDTNALDEAPDSAWFQNRIGLRPVTPGEIVRGAGLLDPPTLPLRIVRAKTGGNNPGFIVEDAAGARYLVKFDTRDNPEQQTAGDVIVNRLFWAIGYNVPSDHVIYFRRRDLTIAPALSGELTDRDVDRLMSQATRRGEEIRALASGLLPGTPKGGWSVRGVRNDDRNDTVPHQDRRVLRGLRVFAAWTGHTDVKPDNTLSMYVNEDGRRFLRHYLIDFGEALGGHQSEKGIKSVGWEHGWDWSAQARGLVTFGFWVRTWEDQQLTPWPSIGYFGAARFVPAAWAERYPYEPFRAMDAADAYWAAKIVLRFTRRQIEAAVAAGELSDPAAARYLVDTLMARRAKIGAAFLDGVTPLDGFSVEGTTLHATDLARFHGIATQSVVVVRDGDRPAAAYSPDARGRTRIPLATDGAYHVLRIHIRRGSKSTPPMELHYKAAAAPRVLGVVR